MDGVLPRERELPVRVYSAEARGDSLPAVVSRAARELWTTRGVLWRLFLRDFAAQDRQKLFGYLWAFLHPLLAIVAFVFLDHAGVLQPGELDVPYPLYIFLGTRLWGFFLAVAPTAS